MKFLRKHWSTIGILLIVVLFFIPPARMQMRVWLNRLVAFSPSQVEESKRERLVDDSWKLRQLSGKRVNFSSSEDEVVLINYWATWCGPCVAEMGSLQNLYADYSDKMKFYFVTNDDPKKVKAFLEKNNMDFPVFYELEQAPKHLKTQSLPTTFLLDRQRNIVIEKRGVADWNSEKTRQIIDGLIAVGEKR